MGAHNTEQWPRCGDLPATHPDGQAELLAGGQENADAPDFWLHPACQQCPAHGGQLHSGWALLSRQLSGSLHPMYLLKRREHQCCASVGTGSRSLHACDEMFKNKNTPNSHPFSRASQCFQQHHSTNQGAFKQLESPRRMS